MSPADRRAARARWEVTVTRPSMRPAADDDLYWLRVDRDERAMLTWELSRELYALAARNRGVFDEATSQFTSVGGEEDDLERRLPRAAFVVTRR